MTKFLNKYFEVTNKRFNNLKRRRYILQSNRLCTWCAPHKGCNSKTGEFYTHYGDRSWKRFRKTQYKNE